MDSPVLDARIRVLVEDGNPYRFKDIHNGMVQDTVGIIGQTVNLPFFRLVYGEDMILGCSERSVFQTLMQGKDIGITVLVVHLHAIRPQLAFSCLLVGKLQVFNADYPVKQVANSFHCLSLQVCLYIRILRVAPTKTVLPNLFFAVGLLPNSCNPGRAAFVARFPICNYIFTSIAENRYSHSYS